MRQLFRLVALMLLVGLASQPLAQDLEQDLARLDAVEASSFGAALEAFELHGEAGVTLALADFVEQPFLARRARARLFKEQAGGSSLPAILLLLGDSDAQVRRILAECLGQLRLASELAPERLGALVQLAELDSQRYVRKAALASLRRAILPGTVQALDQLLDRVDVEFGSAVARVLAGLPQARLRLVERVQQAFDLEPQHGVAPRVLARLLEGYGNALAEIPGGGRLARERAPLVLGVSHVSLEIQRASVTARDRLFQRLFALGEHARSADLLEALGKDGLARHLLLYRGVKLALSGAGDAQVALERARLLIEASQLAVPAKRETFRVYGLHYAGMSLFAAGDPMAAKAYFEQAAQSLRGMLQGRHDLRGPTALRGRARLRNALGGRVMVDHIHMYAMELLWLATCELASVPKGTQKRPEDKVFEWVREAHVAMLEAHVLDVQADAGTDVSGVDSVLEGDFGVEGFVLFNRKLSYWTPESAEHLLGLLGRVCATVMPWEFPGFEPFDGLDRRLTDPLFDGVRRGLYQRIRSEEFYAIHRKLNEIQENSVLLGAAGDQDAENRQLRLRLRWLGMEEQEEAGRRAKQVKEGIDSPSAAQLLTTYGGLARRHIPSLLGLRMGLHSRADGLAAQARERGQAVLQDLAQGLPGANTVWVEWASSRLEELIGATHMDQHHAADAERILLKAVKRLEALENSLKKGGGGLLQVRRQRANVLLSLAVNANVRLDDAARALDFFEQAFELDKRDFMQILRACYRARSGLIEEARGVLRAVTPTPQLYYNLACTYALLGDEDLALDFLQRELEENQPVAGALRRQQLWASEDPDLKSLWEHPRFMRLVAPE